MATEKFSKQDVDSALRGSFPGASLEWAMDMGEQVVVLSWLETPVGRIKVRTSIDSSGLAADAGEDSIRIWLEAFRPSFRNGESMWMPFGKTCDAYTQRTAGWQGRLVAKVTELKKHMPKRDDVWYCPKCGKITFAGVSSSANNPGRPYASHRECDFFAWLDVPGNGVGRTGLSSNNGELQLNPRPISPGGAAGILGVVKAEETSLVVVEDENGGPAIPAPKTVIRNVKPDDEQMAFITAEPEGVYVVSAGAGSGKTTSVIERLAFLKEQGVPLERVVTVAFNRNAAEELLARATIKLGGLSMTAASNICTRHAFCLRRMAANGMRRRKASYSDERKIYDPLAEALWPDAGKRPSFQELKSVIDSLKKECIGPDEAYTTLVQWTPLYAADLTVFYRDVMAKMAADGLFTFPDLPFFYEKMLQDPIFVAKEAALFDYVIVDEAQDTDKQFFRIILKLTKNISVVGDVDQLLYRWAGAWPDFMATDIEKQFETVTRFGIGTNYRSDGEIVDRAARMILNNYEPVGPYPKSLIKNIRPHREHKVKIGFMEYDDVEEEAQGIVDTFKLEGFEPGEVFVLTRTRAQLSYVEAAFAVAGIPALNLTGGSFWEMKHLRLCLNYLRLAYDETDRQAFRDVYNIASMGFRDRRGHYSATRWLGAQFLSVAGDLDNLRYLFSRGSRDLRDMWMDGIQDLLEMMDEIAILDTPVEKAAFIARTVREYIIRRDGAVGDDNDSKSDDIETFVDAVREAGDVEKFFERVDKSVEAAQAAKNKQWNDYAVLSTIHRMKGLERPVVFAAGWSEGEKWIPSKEDYEFRGLLPHTFSVIAPPSEGVLGLGVAPSSVEDERCLAYVTATRARDRLFISSVREYRNAEMRPSRFVTEMGIAV